MATVDPIAITFVPGAVAANTPTALPAYFPRFARVVAVTDQTEASGGTASTTPPVELTVVSSVPSGGLAAGQFYLNPQTQQFQVGTALTTGSVLTIKGYAFGRVPQVA